MKQQSRGPAPRWRRRKDARPTEITVAALEVFAMHGFAAAKLEDIARKAGVSKSSIYLYFPTKEDLFRAIVRAAIVPNVEVIRSAAEASEGALAELVPRLLMAAAGELSRPSVAGFARMVIGESGNFPDLARIWHDEVVSPVIGAVANVIARAQKRGEICAGDPRLHAFSVMGPLIMAALFKEVFGTLSDQQPDLNRLATQHSHSILRGVLTKSGA
jgi:AcrR family transcriptional regulator